LTDTAIPTTPPGPGPWSGSASLRELGEDFLGAVPHADAELADRAGHVPVLRLGRGAWSPPAALADPLALVVLDGVLLRCATIAGRTSAQILDDGELVHPWFEHQGSVPALIRWTALEPLRLAVLDQRFERLAERWPRLHSVLHQRSTEQITRTAVHSALLALPRVDARILGLIWHVADRRGRVGSDGVAVRLPVTHLQLGMIVGAQRSTTTLAVHRLAAEGLLTSDGDGTWLLSHHSRTLLANAR
jgi:hypothetical protein